MSTQGFGGGSCGDRHQLDLSPINDIGYSPQERKSEFQAVVRLEAEHCVLSNKSFLAHNSYPRGIAIRDATCESELFTGRHPEISISVSQCYPPMLRHMPLFLRGVP